MAETDKATVINAAALFTVSTPASLAWEFAKLLARYDGGCCAPVGVLRAPTYVMEVYRLWTAHQNDILDYRMGRISTTQFLDILEKAFPIFAAPEFQLTEADFKMLTENKDDYVSLRDVDSASTSYTSRQLARARLQHCWDSMLSYLEINGLRFEQLMSDQDKGPIYLVSNSNEMHIEKYIRTLMAAHPDMKWKAIGEIDVSNKQDDQPICLTTRDSPRQVYMCLSYRYKCLKTNDQSPAADAEKGITTNRLLKVLFEHLKVEKEIPVENITLVSQWRPDRDMAIERGLLPEKVKTPSVYFQAATDVLYERIADRAVI